MSSPFQPRLEELAISEVEVPKNIELPARPPPSTARTLSTPSWSSVEHVSLTQLGVDNENAVYKGGLVNATSFVGSATAETISAGNSDGGWNSDYPLSVRSEQPWQIRGGRSDQINPGLFAFIRRNGIEYHDISHRTILSGY